MAEIFASANFYENAKMPLEEIFAVLIFASALTALCHRDKYSHAFDCFRACSIFFASEALPVKETTTFISAIIFCYTV